MTKKLVRLTENEFINIIKACVKKALEENNFPKLSLSPIQEDMVRRPLDEGLIVSYPIDKVVRHMMMFFKLSNDLNEYVSNPYNKYGVIVPLKTRNSSDVILLAVRKNTGSVYEQIVSTMENLCGWQLSCIVNDTPISKAYPLWFIESHYVLQFEKRFDNDVSDEVFSRKYIYHVCPSSRLEKIRHIGLTPRNSTWNDFKHNGRIYFYLEKSNLSEVANEFSVKNVNTNGFVLLSINLDFINKDIRFFSDPRQPFGVFTMSNIHPKAITPIEEYSYGNKD
jgi:hypothetical protein